MVSIFLLTDSMVANWESMDDCGDVHSSSNNEADDHSQFLNEEDFLKTVAMAAELHGLTVAGTTVSDPNPKGKLCFYSCRLLSLYCDTMYMHKFGAVILRDTEGVQYHFV